MLVVSPGGTRGKRSRHGGHAIVLFALFVPALLAGTLVVFALRRWPALDPASARAATRVAHDIERELESGTRATTFVEQRTNPRELTGLALTIAFVAVVLGGVIVGILGLVVRTHDVLVQVDNSVAPWGRANTDAFTQHALDAVTSLGGWALTPVVVVVALVELARRPRQALWAAVFVLAVALGQALLTPTIKNIVERARPVVNPVAKSLGPSFPSGHSAGAAACFAALALLAGRGRGRNAHAFLMGVAVAIAVAVAASRVLLGVHWLTDVIGGLALGWAWFALCSIAFGGRLLRFGLPVEAAERTHAAHPG
jgi:undecaprenyl-diphosphatase